MEMLPKKDHISTTSNETLTVFIDIISIKTQRFHIFCLDYYFF